MPKKNTTLPVIILAGGFGTRLRNLLGDKPKALADILNKPFIYYLLEKLILEGYSNFIFSLHYKANQIINVIEDSNNFNKVQKTYIIEPEALGTGGAILYTLWKCNLNDDFLVVNSDSIIENGYFNFNNLKSPTIGLVRIQNCNRFGSVELSQDSKIIDFIEKNGNIESGIINAGIYKLNKKVFEKYIPGEKFSLELDIFPSLVKNKELNGILLNTDFIDIGVPEDYYNYCKLIKSKHGN